MESIGDKLRETRKQKGYSVEQVARDTHIAKRFINSLEEEDFDAFPGEPYLIGFLRTYSEFLELNPQETLTLYKNLKLQETPAPMDELIVRKGPRPSVIAALAVLVVVALGLGGYLLVSTGVLAGLTGGTSGTESAADGGADSDAALAQAEAPEPAPVEGDEYLLQEVFLERRFFVGDRVSVPVGEVPRPVTVEAVAETVTVATPEGSRELRPGGEETLDLDGDGRGDVRLLVRQLDASTNPASAVLRFDRVLQQPVASGDADVGDQPEGFGNQSGTPGIGSTNVPSRSEPAIVIRRAEAPEPFDVNIDFRGYSYFRSQVNDQERNERYVQNGDTFDVTSESELRLWLSNAGAAQASISGNALSLGDAGSVASYLVTWVLDDENGGYQLELVPLY